jgi:hypothetical protein
VARRLAISPKKVRRVLTRLGLLRSTNAAVPADHTSDTG